MKKLFLLSFIAFWAAFGQVSAQCSQCTPVNCAAQKPAGGLCNNLPDDTAGKPYNQVISFYMPHELRDPTTLAQCSGCSYVELRRIRIVGIQGLPTGVTATPSHSNGIYDVQAGDTLGCVTFCGTPVAPGTYILIVNLLADVTAHGTPIGNVDANGQSQNYRDTFVLYPGTSVCPQTFSIGNGPCVLKSCDSISVNLDASLTNTHCPNLISYAWDYGNGVTSAIKTPGVINYTTPDTFHLNLTTTYYTYRIQEVSVQITGGWTGDIEELTSASSPEPYLVIGAVGFNNRGNGVSNTRATFSNLNLVIPDANCGDPLEILVFDEDQGPPFGSQDDNCGTHHVTPGVPNQITSTVSNSNIAVTFDTVATSSITESLDVIVFPHPPLPVIIAERDSFCDGDSSRLSLNVSLEGYAINWYLNDTIELPSNDSVVYVSLPGDYKVKITNTETGCSETSPVHSIAVGTAAPSSIAIIFTGTREYVTPFPSSGFAVDWYFNGNLVVGQNGKFLPYLGAGQYSAELYNIDFPYCRTATGPDSIVSGINDLADNSVYAINVFPNPNNGLFNVNFTSDETQDIRLTVTSTIGQMVYDRKIESFTGTFNQQLDLSTFSKGVYIATIETKYGKHNSRVVVQ
jgi:hypothetical protein